MSNRKLLTLGVVLVFTMIMVVAGALVLPKLLKVTNVEAEQAFTNARDIMRQFNSAEFKLTMNMDMTINFDSSLGMSTESQSAASQIVATGKVDLLAQKMSMDMQISMMGTELAMSQVLAGEDIYLKVGNAGFQKMSISELMTSMYASNAYTFDQFKEQQLWSQVDSSTVYEYIGEEKVNGVECYKYKVQMDNSKFVSQLEDVKGQLAEVYQSMGLEVSADQIYSTVGKTSFTTWVSKDAKNPVQEAFTLENYKLGIEGLMSFSIDKMEVNLAYSAVNQPVSIDIPAI